ncbi:MAG: hypothetical protein GY765_02640 [bacterium]|nr:hypothetical protein [bacterium]
MKKLNLKEMKNLKGGALDFDKPCHIDLLGCFSDTCMARMVCYGVTFWSQRMTIQEYLDL